MKKVVVISSVQRKLTEPDQITDASPVPVPVV